MAKANVARTAMCIYCGKKKARPFRCIRKRVMCQQCYDTEMARIREEASRKARAAWLTKRSRVCPQCCIRRWLRSFDPDSEICRKCANPKPKKIPKKAQPADVTLPVDRSKHAGGFDHRREAGQVPPLALTWWGGAP